MNFFSALVKKMPENHKEHQYKEFGEQFVFPRRKTKMKEVQFNTNRLNESSLQLSEGNASQKIISSSKTNIHKNHKKKLKQENKRLRQENWLLTKQLKASEDVYNKRVTEMTKQLKSNENFYSRKIMECKEMLESIHTCNEDLRKEKEDLRQENENLKEQHQDLLISFNDCQKALLSEKQKYQNTKLNLDKIICELDTNKKHNESLETDLLMLKTVVYRLNLQLERYQEKLTGTNSLPIKHDVSGSVKVERESLLLKNHDDHEHIPISWGEVNSHTLGPLLNAYQETILEKDHIIGEYEKNIANFTEKMKEVIKENEELHRKLVDDENCSVKLNGRLEKMTEELKMTKEQNELLIKKCALKQEKLEEVLKTYEQKVELISRDYGILMEEYRKSKSETEFLKEKNKNLLESCEDFKNEKKKFLPVSVHESAISECKKLYEDLKSQYESEKLKLSNNIGNLSSQIENLNHEVSKLNSEKMELQNQLKQEEKAAKKLRVMYQELEDAQTKLKSQKHALKKQLRKAMTFANDMVIEQETLLKILRDHKQENRVVKTISKEISSKMDTLRNQLKTVQKDAWKEFTNVEKRMQDKNDLISSIKQEHAEEIRRLKAVIKEKDN